jgi:hypothetical protein
MVCTLCGILFVSHPDLSLTCNVGHSGHETSEHTVKSLPPVIRSYLENLLAANPNATPSVIGDAFSKAIQDFDKSFEDDLKSVIPGNFESLSDEELQGVINDQATGARIYTKVVRCMRGSCSVIVVIDPLKENLWSINLGDCEAGQCTHPAGTNTKLTRMTWTSAWRKGVIRRLENFCSDFDTQCDDRCREGEDPCRSSWGGRSYTQQPCSWCFRTHSWCVT